MKHMRDLGLAVVLFSSLSMPPSLAANDSPEGPASVVQLESVSGAGEGLRAAIGGHSAMFLFDTGAGISTVTPQFARVAGCRVWGQTTGFRMSGERLDLPRCDDLRLEIAGRTYELPIAGVFDIMALLPGSSTTLAGSLGLDVFSGKQITIEPTMKRIVIETPKSFSQRVEGAREVPARLVRDAEGVALAIDVGVPTPAGMAWMELDTGNGGTLVVGKHVAPLLGLDAGKKQPQPAKFQLAGGIQVEGPARVRDLIMDGNIGQQVLEHWNITIDLAVGRVWFAPAPAS